MPAYFIEESKVSDFLFAVGAGRVYAQTRGEEGSDFEALERGKPVELAFRQPRAPRSIKAFLFPVKERVAVYPAAAYDWKPEVNPDNPAVVAGLRACDLVAAKILDSVFIQEDYVDPFYSLRREGLHLVTVDCAEPAEQCFCNLLEGRPYATEGYDVNLSPVAGGYVAEAGSDKGKEMLLAAKELFREATDEELAARESNRQGAERRLAEQNDPYAPGDSLQKIVAAAVEDDRWMELAAGCVECGSCTAICPTCHCFQLYDQPSAEEAGPNERVKSWDSCVFASYSRMAGVGGMKPNPRPELRQRFSNRVLHKFAWFPENMGMLGCVGCGRCTEGCLGGEDLRELLKDLERVEAKD